MTRTRAKFSLPIFLLVTFGLAWPLEIGAFIWSPDLGPVVMGGLLNGLLVALAAFICGGFIFKDGFSDAGWGFGPLRGYLIAIAFPLVLWILPWLIDIWLGYRSFLTESMITRWIGLAAWMVPLSAISAFGSEFAWRGYLLPRLARNRSPEFAVLAHGIIWWVWRLPALALVYMAEGRELAGISGLPVGFTTGWVILLGALVSVMHAVIYAYFRVMSGSIIVVTVYHLLYTSLRDTIWLSFGFGPVTQWWALIVVTLVGVLLLWKGNWGPLAELGRKSAAQEDADNKRPHGE